MHAQVHPKSNHEKNEEVEAPKKERVEKVEKSEFDALQAQFDAMKLERDAFALRVAAFEAFLTESLKTGAFNSTIATGLMTPK